MKNRLKRRAAHLVVLFCVTAGLASAQSSGIQGVATDPSMATIPAVTVQITNVDTGVVTTSETNSSGRYSAPFLKPGTYSIEARGEGFAPATREGLKLDVGQTARVDFALKVGTIVETVEVSAAAALLESETTEVGQVIENKRIVEMPLNGRNYLQLATLSAGAIPAEGSRESGAGGFVAMGARSRQTNVLVDGIDNSTRVSGGVLGFEAQASEPSVDAVAEFKVLTTNFSAEHGFRMGAKVLVTIKSGTNRLHGSLFHFLRNDQLDANNFFANRAGADKAPYRHNQFGGTLGGPTIRNRTFFFGSYQGTRTRVGSNITSTTPSQLLRGGDFSMEAVNRNTIFDPLSTTGSGANAIRQQFPNNAIPASRFDSVTRQLIDLYPLPNIAGREFASNNFFFSPSDSDDANQYDYKVDHNFSDADRIFFRHSIRRVNEVQLGGMPAQTGGPTIGSRQQTVEIQGDNLAFGWTHSFSPTVFNEMRFGYTHLPTRFGLVTNEALNERYGIKGAPGDSFDDGLNQGFSHFSLTNYNNLGTPCCWPNINNMDNLHLADNVWMQRGNHTLKFGFEHRRLDIFRQAQRFRRGEFRMRGFFTAEQPNVGASRNATGNSLADFLLGWSDRTNVGNTNGENPIVPYWGFYAQDDWKLTSRLTLNLGLRYELFIPPAYLDATANQFPGVSAYLTAFSGVSPSDPRYETLVRPTSNGDRGMSTDGNNWAPRVGISYQLNQKTVIRTGAGLFFGEFDNANSGGFWAAQPPIFTEVATVGSNVTAAAIVQEGFPAVEIPATVPPPGVSVNTPPLRYDNNYTGHWFLDVQRELPADILFIVGYQGSSSSNLMMFHDINNGGAHPTIPEAQRRVRPEFTRVDRFFSGGNSNYNAMRATLEKRFSGGLTFLSSYTWAHSIDAQPQRNDDSDRTIVNMYNLGAERGNSNQDIRHNYTNSFTWELPFGRNQPLGSSWNRVADAIAGGWAVSGILTLRAGAPFSVAYPGDSQNSNTTNRGDRIASGEISNPTIDRWFDEQAFVQAAPGIYGNAGRNALFGPGDNSFDFMAAKRFQMPWEGHSLQFRFEAFNFTNTPVFGDPAAGLRSDNTATINSAGPPRRIQFGLKYLF